ncbi:MAG: S8 family serine peptidase [Bacteroidetes bacterium]|nr:S8 family serine peptidase [Bacteroidota bacterium]
MNTIYGNLNRYLLAAILHIVVFQFNSCDEDNSDDMDPQEEEFGQTPQEYLDWLDDEGVDYFVDDNGNPYTTGQKMIRFENGFDEQKLEAVVEEIAALNDIEPSDVTVKNCGCGSEDFIMVEYEEKLNADLEPAIGSMGDPDADNDGLTSQTSDGVSVSNNYILTPMQQNLNLNGDLPVNFGPPDQGVGEGFIAEDDRVVIGVLDSGLDFDHPGLGMYDNFRLWKPMPEDCYELGYDFVNQDGFAGDDHGHGTQVTGVILETLRDYDIPVSIMPLKISDASGSVSLWDMFCALGFAVSHGAEVINISAGWYGGPNPIINKLIEDHPDVLFVFSAGNEGVNTDIIENSHFPSGYVYFPNAISVAALNADKNAVADFSNFGPNSISIAAPGTSVWTLTPCDGAICDDPDIEVSGTSFSAPHVAAIAAAVLHCTNVEASEVRFNLYDFGIPLPSLTGHVQSGKVLDIHTILELDDCAL